MMADLPMPQEVGDAYLLKGYLFEGNYLVAFAYPGPAQEMVVVDGKVVGTHTVPKKWGWYLQGEDGDIWYLGRPFQEQPEVPWVHLIPCDEIVVLQQRRDVMPSEEEIEEIAKQTHIDEDLPDMGWQ